MDEQTTQLLLIRSYKQSKIRKIKHTLRQMFVLSNAVLPCLGFTLCCSYIKSHRRTSLNSRHDVRVVLCADSRGHRKTHTHNRGFAIRQSCSLIHIETLAFIYSNFTSLSFSHSLMYFSSTHIYKHTHTQSTYHLHPTLSPMVQKEPSRSSIVMLWLSSLCVLDVGGILLITYQH